MTDADLHSNTRRVKVTHDGRPIGWTEPLETEYALRLAISRKVNYRKFMKSAEERGRQSRKAATFSSAQKRSATRRGQ